jgi:hypothetical protein
VSATGATGVIYFRPQGPGSAAGQAYVTSAGAFITTNNIGSSTGYYIKAGQSGGLGASNFNINHNGSVAGLYVDFTYMGTFAYTSDYRIKKDVVDLPSKWETVKALRPISYTQAEFSPPSHLRGIAEAKAKDAEQIPGPLFVADDIERWGFLAHELQEVLVPSAASCEKDAEDAIQTPDPWTVLAAVVSALQEAMARIETLEAA